MTHRLSDYAPDEPSWNHWSVPVEDRHAGMVAALDLGVHPLVTLDRETARAADEDTTDPRANPCPECPTGEVVLTESRNPGASGAHCSEGCGWSA